MLEDAPSRSRVFSEFSGSELGRELPSQSSFEGSHSGNLLERSNEAHDRDRMMSQTSASSLKSGDSDVMDKLRKKFQAYGLGGNQSSKELSFTDRRSTLRDRNSMNKGSLSKGMRVSLTDDSSASNSLIRGGSSVRSGKSFVMNSETKMTTSLRTYLKLSQSMGPIFVLNAKKRQNIFEAIKIYHRNENIAQLSVTCLELLAKKSDDKAVFLEIMKNFGNLAALVGTHLTNADFAKNFLSLVVCIIKKNKTEISQLDDPAYVETFRQIRSEHPSNRDIQDLYMILTDKLGLQKIGIDSNFATPRGSIHEKEEEGGSALRSLRRRIQEKLALGLADSQSSFEDSSMLPTVSPSPVKGGLDRSSVNILGKTKSMDAQELDEWAADDLMDNMDGDLVSWDSDGEDSVNIRKAKGRHSISRTYTARRLKELQMQNAQREQSVLAHKEALSKLQNDYEKIQNQHQADKTVYNSFLTSMQEAEKKFKEEISKLKEKNELIKITETEVSKEAETLFAERKAVQAEMDEKNQQFENMKAMVTQQMNEAKSHYVGVRQRLEDAKAQLAKIQDSLLETENKLTATQKEQEIKVEEYNNLQTTYQTKQRAYEESRIKAANLENRYNTIRSDFSSKIATNHQELAKGQSDIRLAHQMHGTFKSQLMKLKMERTGMLKRIQALQSLNMEGNRIDIEVKHLKKENADLKARLGDLIKKDVAGDKLRKYQLMNAKLKKEKAELVQMTEMLLNRTESQM